MDRVHDFFGSAATDDNRTTSPESLAWDLVMSNDIERFGGIMENFVTDGRGFVKADRYEVLADEFQILISIYMEMVFNVLKANYMGELVNEDGEI